MAAGLKIALGTFGIGAVSLGGYFLGKHMNIENWKPLSEDKSTQLEKLQYGSQYKDYLTSISGNDLWWIKFLLELKKTNTIITKKFKELKSDEKTHADLKEVCRSVYKANDDDVDEKVTGQEENKFKESEVWKFCSPARTVADMKETYAKGTYGETRKQELGAIRNNDIFWKQRLKTIKEEETEESVDGLAWSEFKKLKPKTITLHKLKSTCEAAYKVSASKTWSDSDKYPFVEVISYCSLKGKNQNIYVPHSHS